MKIMNYYTHITTLPPTQAGITLTRHCILHYILKIRKGEKKKWPVTRTFVKVKKQKQPSLVDIISVFSEKDKITIDCTSSSFRAGRKLTMHCAYLQYAGILPDSFGDGHGPDSLWISSVGWTPRIGSQPRSILLDCGILH